MIARDMDDQLRCSLCHSLLPLAKSSLGKTLVGGIATTLGLAKTKSLGGTIVLGLIGVLAGHVVDVLIDRATKPMCAHCESFQPA